MFSNSTACRGTLSVVGAGVIGLRIRQHFAALGVRVTFDRPARSPVAVCRRGDRRHAVLSPAGKPRHPAPQRERRADRCRRGCDGPGSRVRLHLASGKTIVTEKALYAVAARTGATTRLALDKCGLACDGRGRLVVDEHYQTEVTGHLRGGRRHWLSGACLDPRWSRAGSRSATPSASARAAVPALFPYGILRGFPKSRWSARPRRN